jgi:hypothetical protein
MIGRRIAWSLLTLAVVLTVTVVAAQWDQRRRYRGYGRGGPYGGGTVDRQGVPEWENDPEFKKDVFTFVRVL